MGQEEKRGRQAHRGGPQGHTQQRHALQAGENHQDHHRQAREHELSRTSRHCEGVAGGLTSAVTSATGAQSFPRPDPRMRRGLGTSPHGG